MVNYFNLNFIIRIVNRYRKWQRRINQLKKFKIDFNRFVQIDKSTRFIMDWNDCLPMLHDNSYKTTFNSHYIYHPAWAARVLKEITPKTHVDFSSSLHFCTIISAFIPSVFYDYRPADLELSDLESKRANLTNLELSDNSIECLSCMHTIEHIGLGRYGDELDSEGDIKAINELQRVAIDHILIVVPIGMPKIYFNAHRVYDPIEFVKYFTECNLINFAFVDDLGNFKINEKLKNAINEKFACGCFYFRKKIV